MSYAKQYRCVYHSHFVPGCWSCVNRKDREEKSRKILALLLRRARDAHKALVRGRNMRFNEQSLRALEGAENEIHNTAELARRLFYGLPL